MMEAKAHWGLRSMLWPETQYADLNLDEQHHAAGTRTQPDYAVCPDIVQNTNLNTAQTIATSISVGVN